MPLNVNAVLGVCRGLCFFKEIITWEIVLTVLRILEKEFDRVEDPPQKNTVEIETSGVLLEVVDDLYSDRLRCDHPPTEISGYALGESLLQTADDCGRSRVVALVNASLSEGLEANGFELEGVIPGFYAGEDDCAVLGYGLDDYRMDLAHADAVKHADGVLERPFAAFDFDEAPVIQSVRATLADAIAIADLMDQTFRDYPTPSSDPDYISEQIESGIPFRIIRDGNDVVACASADLVREALAAELTDCATRPTHRGRGYMQGILHELMLDLQAMGYPTAFTLARARIPGVNRAFQKLGFRRRGRMAQSCRIGEGFEDMNIWSRSIPLSNE
jgi:putative beta-lysine N-acetyltransferase